MMEEHKCPTSLFLILGLLYLISLFPGLAGEGQHSSKSPAGVNPFSPKAYLNRYWKTHVSNDLPKPLFFLNKASPMTAAESATFTKLATQNALAANMPSFCSSGNLLCFPDLSPSLAKNGENVNFVSYSDKNFTNYGSNRLGGVDSFKNYSDNENIPVDSFRRYSRNAAGHNDKFANYAPDGNVIDQSFNTYATAATGGAGDFKGYAHSVNNPNLRFTSYTDDGNGHQQSFASYSDDANAGDQSFKSYGKNGNAASNDFNSYGKNSNVLGSTFTNYGDLGNAANDTFTSYGFNGNVPENNFKNYGGGGNAAVDTFTSYRDQSNVGDDSFQFYAKNSNDGKANFVNYGNSFNEGTDKFTGYGNGAKGQKITFKGYGVNNTFKDYANKKSISFAQYAKRTSGEVASLKSGEKPVNRWVEPGKFFREKMLKTGTVMPMPDIRDKMPKRSFLPRAISSKLPFSSAQLADMKQIFHAGDNSSIEAMMTEALSDCERAPSRDETKRCVTSAEDMIDFATSVLGHDVAVRTTENTVGSKQNIMIGSVKGINGGKITKSVSCHQSMYPYLLYYCHSVPKVRVYEADILDPKSESKINRGVAICHIDTSAWSSGHGAFAALGSGPGKIEVCHWIFENDMIWTTTD